MSKTQGPENHTLFSGTYMYPLRQNKGVPLSQVISVEIWRLFVIIWIELTSDEGVFCDFSC